MGMTLDNLMRSSHAMDGNGARRRGVQEKPSRGQAIWWCVKDSKGNLLLSTARSKEALVKKFICFPGDKIVMIKATECD
jgi:hypothetical protein